MAYSSALLPKIGSEEYPDGQPVRRHACTRADRLIPGAFPRRELHDHDLARTTKTIQSRHGNEDFFVYMMANNIRKQLATLQKYDDRTESTLESCLNTGA